MPTQFPYIAPVTNWDGSAKLIKVGSGHLLALEITTGAEAGLVYLHYYNAASTGAANSENRFWVTPLEASQTRLIVPCGVWQDFDTGLVLKVTDAADGTGSVPANPLILCGRYR